MLTINRFLATSKLDNGGLLCNRLINFGPIHFYFRLDEDPLIVYVLGEFDDQQASEKFRGKKPYKISGSEFDAFTSQTFLIDGTTGRGSAQQVNTTLQNLPTISNGFGTLKPPSRRPPSPMN
jgi:hypothetical protein